ncbi:MAG: hypothetical protein GY852_04910 [bacterium]|nr:hypothetical protein [bacterium]
MSIRSLKKGILKPAIEKIISDPSYKTNMEKLQAFQGKRDGALEAAKIAIELVGS